MGTTNLLSGILSPIMFPHAYQFELLGGNKTQEGTKYLREHSTYIDFEYQIIVEVNDARKLIGGTNRIHKLS